MRTLWAKTEFVNLKVSGFNLSTEFLCSDWSSSSLKIHDTRVNLEVWQMLACNLSERYVAMHNAQTSKTPQYTTSDYRHMKLSSWKSCLLKDFSLVENAQVKRTCVLYTKECQFFFFIIISCLHLGIKFHCKVGEINLWYGCEYRTYWIILILIVWHRVFSSNEFYIQITNLAA